MTNIAPTGDLETVIASFSAHADAESAVRRLAAGGLPIEHISIIGRHFETHEGIQGFYRPAEAIQEGAKQGAWFGGIFGFLTGATGFFVLPVVGALMILGPLASLVAGAIGGAGVGALTSGLVMMGIPHDQAIKYQERVRVGEFLVALHGTPSQSARAHEILNDSLHTYIQTHTMHAAPPELPGTVTA